MKYESELKSQQIEACNVNISHLSEQIEALASSLHEKEIAVTQLQSELLSYQQVANSPELLTKSLKLMTQIAELEHRLQEAEYQKQRAELERETALQMMKARQKFEIQVHTQLSKCDIESPPLATVIIHTKNFIFSCKIWIKYIYYKYLYKVTRRKTHEVFDTMETSQQVDVYLSSFSYLPYAQ